MFKREVQILGIFAKTVVDTPVIQKKNNPPDLLLVNCAMNVNQKKKLVIVNKLK